MEQAEAPGDVIKAELKEFVQAFRRLATLCGERLVHVPAELTLRNAVRHTHLLLLQHLLAVFAWTTAAGALVLSTAVSRERKLLCLRFLEYGRAEALCNLVSWSGFHNVLDATRLRRTRAVVRHRCRVLDGTNLNALTGESAEY